MRSTLIPGVSKVSTLTVDRPRTIDFLGEDLRVYATPELVRDFEVTCRELLLEHSDSGEDSVGTGISVAHTGATLLGMEVEVSAQVKEVTGRTVKFILSARDGVEVIATGEHSRVVVNVDKLRSRVAAKRAAATSP